MKKNDAISIFKELFKEQKIEYVFDEKCIRTIEFVFAEGSINPAHHVSYDRLCVKIEGQEPKYVPIDTHRETLPFNEALQKFKSLTGKQHA